MAHFEIPTSGAVDAYYDIVDNEAVAVGQVWRMRVAPDVAKAPEVALFGGTGLDVLSNNPTVVDNPLDERSLDGRRIFRIVPKANGTTLIHFGVLNPC
jgi:hypothetical protein